MRDLFNKGYKYYKVQLNNTFPDYILNNQGKLNQWIEQQNFQLFWLFLFNNFLNL